MRTCDKVIIATAILALVSLAGIAVTVVNYIEGMRSAQHLRPLLSEIRIDDLADEFTAVFRLQNRASIPLRLDDVNLSFYVNGQYVGSNYQRFSPRTVQSAEEPILEFTVPLQPFYRQRLEQARASGQLLWSASGVARVVLPYRERALLMSIRAQWDGRP